MAKAKKEGYGEPIIAPPDAKVVSLAHEPKEMAFGNGLATLHGWPHVFVVMLDRRFDPEGTTDEVLKKIREDTETEWKRIWDGKPPMPIFVLPPGVCQFGTI